MRPVVLVSRESAYRRRDALLVVPVTTRIRNLPTEVALGAEEGLPQPCVANADAIAAVNRRRLTNRAGALSEEKLAALDRALRFALDL
jgi:mRNA interferase MazF